MATTPKPSCTPNPYDEHPGWHYADDGKRYFGVGRVIEKGATHGGDIYARVEPVKWKPGSKYHFFDPLTFEEMSFDYYPYQCFPDLEELEPDYDRYNEFPRFSGVPKVGDESDGLYCTPNRMEYLGLEGLLNPKKPGTRDCSYVEPIPGRNDDDDQFFDLENYDDISKWEMPRVSYPGYQKSPHFRKTGKGKTSKRHWYGPSDSL